MLEYRMDEIPPKPPGWKPGDKPYDPNKPEKPDDEDEKEKESA